MNKQKKNGNISWTDYTWNPIQGLCPVDCKLPDGRSYCYARRIYQRFGRNPEVRLDAYELDDIYRYHNEALLKLPVKIFVCSTI